MGNFKTRRERLKNYFDFLWAMTEKEIKTRYKRTILGFLWIILNPVLQMLVIGLIFSFFVKIPDYFLFLISGLLPWQFFSLSIQKATPSFVYERNLLQKAQFPKEAIPLAIVFANFINLTIAFLLLILFLLLIGSSVNVVMLAISLLWLLIFTVGLALFTSTLNVKYRDIGFLTQSFMILWFYLTPIIYNISLIPPKLHFIYFFNPLSSIFELLHLSLTGQGNSDNVMLIINMAISAIVVVIGIGIFVRNNRYFVDWL